jgi:hypothetical protein
LTAKPSTRRTVGTGIITQRFGYYNPGGAWEEGNPEEFSIIASDFPCIGTVLLHASSHRLAGVGDLVAAELEVAYPKPTIRASVSEKS